MYPIVASRRRDLYSLFLYHDTMFSCCTCCARMFVDILYIGGPNVALAAADLARLSLRPYSGTDFLLRARITRTICHAVLRCLWRDVSRIARLHSFHTRTHTHAQTARVHAFVPLFRIQSKRHCYTAIGELPYHTTATCILYM